MKKMLVEKVVSLLLELYRVVNGCRGGWSVVCRVCKK